MRGAAKSPGRFVRPAILVHGTSPVCVQPRMELFQDPRNLRELGRAGFGQFLSDFYSCWGFEVKPDTETIAVRFGFRLFSENRFVALVHCSAWHQTVVGLSPVKYLAAKVAQTGVEKGIFITPDSFSPEVAAHFKVTREPVELIDGRNLVFLVQGLPASARRKLFRKN